MEITQLLQEFSNDFIIIGTLLIEIIILTILGFSSLKKSRSLSTKYFSAVFFVVSGLSAVNIIVRALSIVIEKQNLDSSSIIVEFYMLCISIVTASMIGISIIYAAGFYIINFGERYYRDKKLTVVFYFILFLVMGSVIAGNYLPAGYGIEFVLTGDIPEPYTENFEIMNPLAIYLIVISLIFFIVNIMLLSRILPETENKVQKRRIIILIIVIVCNFLGTMNLLVIDMQLPIFSWNYLYITTILFLLSIFLLYFSITQGKKKDSKLKANL